VILRLDETIICETPPLYKCYGRKGEQVRVPITGNRAKRLLPGALNSASGAGLLLLTTEWVQETHQYFLSLIRAHGRGWQIVLFADRGSPHTAAESLEVAATLNLAVRFLPRATPELNAMAQLWRHVKGRSLADRTVHSIETTALTGCQDIFAMPVRERLRKAGVLSGNFWLTP
jgi:transposase